MPTSGTGGARGARAEPELRRIPIGSLMLNPENPRHDPVDSQPAAIAAVIAEQGRKLTRIAADIASNGISPIDALLVTKTAAGYLVLEGNRRVAAIKLLQNPALAGGTSLERDFQKLAKNATYPTELWCAVVASREDAEHWLELRHNGESGGVGVVNWDTAAATRFFKRPGSQAAKALAFLESVRAAYPKNHRLQENLEKLGSRRLTTLGRLVSDPNFRKKFGLEERKEHYASHYGAAELSPAIERVVSDFATDVTVTDVKSKAQRAEYLEGLPLPGLDDYRPAATPLSARVKTTAPRSKPARTRKERERQTFLLPSLRLNNLGHRIPRILAEIQRLDVDQLPNAAALLLRVLIELSVDQVFTAQNWPTKDKDNRDIPLWKRIRTCLSEIDPSGKDDRYEYVRMGLQDHTSLYAMATMHAFVHNPRFHASAGDVRAAAANYEAFLDALDGLV